MQTKARLKRAAIHIVGWTFILLGVLGLFLPILQGILFILIGLVLLSSVSPWAERLLHKLRSQFPRISSKLDEATSKAKDLQRRVAARLKGVKLKARRAHGRTLGKKKRRPTTNP